MMAVAYSILVLVLSLLNGGGNDLIDYLPTKSFWDEKQVEVSVESMLAELEEKPVKPVDAFIAQLGSPDAETRDNAVIKIREAGGASSMKSLQSVIDSPDAEVRRRAKTLLRDIGGDEIADGVRKLMAIRTLGELGKPEAVAGLKELLGSKKLFVAEYAQVAIDRIEGRVSEVRGVPKQVADDVWLLPESCKTVGQLVPRRGTPQTPAEFVAAIRDANLQDKEESVAMVTRVVLSLAEQFGNVRIDGVTFGISGTLVPVDSHNSGYVAVIVRGQYDSQWARTFAKSEHVTAREEAGAEIFEPDNEQTWIMPSDNVFVFLASPASDSMPINELAETIQAGKRSSQTDGAIRKFVESIDTQQMLWAASILTQKQKSLPVVTAFDTFALVGTRGDKFLNLILTAAGPDAAQVAEAAQAINSHAKESAEFLNGIKGVPVIDMSVQLLRSMQAAADGKTAKLTARLDTTPAAILSLPMLYDEESDSDAKVPPNPRLRRGQDTR